MNITIRQAALSDVANLAATGQRIWLETYLPEEHRHLTREQRLASGDKQLIELTGYVDTYFSSENIKALVQNDANYFALVEIDAVLAGFALVLQSEPERCIEYSNVLEIDKFYIQSRFHGKGVALFLMEHLKEYCRDEKKDALWLSVWHRNDRAIGFYKKQDFKDVGECFFTIEGSKHLNKVMLWHCR